MANIYTTAKGKQVNLDQLIAKHETMPAVGNAKLTARGDLLGPGGKIVKTREELLQEYYNQNPRNI